MGKIKKIICILSATILFNFTFLPVVKADAQTDEAIKKVLVALGLNIEQKEVGVISKENTVEKETPKEEIDLDNISGTLEFPFLIDDNFLTSISHLCGETLKLNNQNIGNLVQINLKNNTKTPIKGLKIKVELLSFSAPSIQQVNIPANGSVTLALSPTFNDDILKLTEQRLGTIYVCISDKDGKLIYEKTKKITILSRNDAFLKYLPFLGVFITPNDKKIDELITYAAEKVEGRTIAGYQKTSLKLEKEIKAIYDTISEVGTHYRSSTLSFLESDKLQAQRTYFPAESLDSTGANCLDGTLLFASAFENIGLDTALVVVPSHIFVAVDLVKGSSKDWRVIETTMVGNASYEQSVKTAEEEFTKFFNAKTMVFLTVADIRKDGIKPFPLAIETNDNSLKDKFGVGIEKIFEIQIGDILIMPSDCTTCLSNQPTFYVRIISNNKELLNSKKDVGYIINNSAFHITYKDLKTRITLKKTDTVEFLVYHYTVLGNSRLVNKYTLNWDNFISKNYTMSTASKSFFNILVKEIK